MNERDLFLSALEIEDPAARKAHLQAGCAGNLELLSRVESLLASHERESRFLQTPVVEQLGDEAAATIVVGTGSTDEEVTSQSQERDRADEEIPLGYLEPSTKPGSLGRLAHYEILEVVGQGAFGTVLRAFDDKLQRVVAIKVMAPELAATSPARKRFVREAQASAQIRHENVVSVYAVEERPIPHLVMEYIPGVTLQQRLDERGPLDAPTVLRLGTQIAEGLAAAHAKDLIHRDIKPGNILLETGMRDRVKITDFGLARAADDASMTQSGVIAGTPMYMAPEQALGQKLDQRADLFSFGSVLYQMVSGRPPFRASSTLAVLKRLTEETPRPIQEIIPETPRWLCDIIAKLHAKNPDDRFQSAKEVAELLEQHSAHLQNPSQVSRPAAVSLAPAKPHTDPETRSPLSKTQRPLMVPQGIRWPLLIATGIMFLISVLLLVVTESTGVTHLFTGSGVVQGPPPNAPNAELVFGEDSLPGKWVQLFNGQDLDGWVRNTDFPGNWRVEKGVLVGSGPNRIGMLQSARKDIGDFHLRAEVLINSAQADGGIFFRSLPQSSNELNVCFDPKLPTQQTGSLVIHKPGTKDSTWYSAPRGLAKANEWMTVEIIAQGNQATTKINGQTAAISQALCGNPRGHIMLQHLGPQTVVRFRKIEIKELPPSDSNGEAASRRYASDEWIDVIPLIDPRLDKHGNKLTGRNEWRVDNGELVVGYADERPNKLLLPLDSDWQAFECEFELTRRTGESAFNLNFPVKQSDVPLVVDLTGRQVSLGRRAVIGEINPIQNGERAKISVRARKQDGTDHLEVTVNGKSVGTWTGNRSAIEGISGEGYAHARRLSLWIPGGSEYVFHQIRIRMLDGGTAETLRPVPRTPQLAAPPTAIAPFDAAQAKAHQKAWAKHLGVDVEITNTIGMKLRLIPPGEFTMGSSEEEINNVLASTDTDWIKHYIRMDLPARRAVVREPFWMGIHEVTIGQFRAFVDATNYKTQAELAGGGVDWSSEENRHTQQPECVWNNPKYVASELHPVAFIGLDDAAKFCAWLSEKEGRRYEIPTGEQWEFACRAGTTTRFFFGDDETRLKDFGWIRTNSRGKNKVVGLLGANPFGLFDTLGNVSEETSDPIRLSVERGGNCECGWQLARSATRTASDLIHPNHGFRVVVVGELRPTTSAPGSNPVVKQEPLSPTFKNTIGMEFVIVPKGKSWLGGGKDKPGDKEVEMPADFYLGKYEVTQEEWEKVMGENPSHFSRNGEGKDAVKDIQDADLKRFPMENVSWDQSQIFVAKLNQLETEMGWVYRLPTTDEWEYACRGGPMADKLGSAFDFYFAKPTNTLLPEHANFEHGNGLKRTCKVGLYEANVLGLFDMHGNVWEWCDDTEKASDGASHRVDRGAGWLHDSDICRAAGRGVSAPSHRYSDLGLRLVQVPSGIRSPEAKTPPVAVAPFTDVDVQRITALPAAEQIEEARKELMRRNPGFDGKMETKIEDAVVTEFRINTDHVTDIAPIRVWSALRVLACRGTFSNNQPNGQLADLTPLEGMNLAGLTHLDLSRTKVSDAAMVCFKNCSTLSHLDLGSTKVSDAGLADFKDCKNLRHLDINHTQMGDAGLANFKGMRLAGLGIDNTAITDLTPLQGMPLEEIHLTPKNITTGLDILRAMKSIKTVGIEWKNDNALPAAEFWERYDKGEFKE